MPHVGGDASPKHRGRPLWDLPAGAAYNPFEQEEVLGVTILKNMAQKLDYRHTDGRNQISIEL